jgi:GntR family transcriptional regulator, transcriptional repressor for pyruvate dehydrogenase complex
MRVQALPRSNLSAAITSQLRDMVLNGELRPGSQLPGHRELAKMFGVSVTSVREAISALASAGVLDAQQGRGTFVSAAFQPDPGSSAWLGQPLDVAEQNELLEARDVLECALARLAAERATEEQIKALRKTVDEMRRNQDNPPGYLDADVSFHMMLAAAAHNRVLLRSMYAVRTLLRRDLVHGLEREHETQGAIRSGLEDHVQLVEAVAARDPQRAEHYAAAIVAGYIPAESK